MRVALVVGIALAFSPEVCSLPGVAAPSSISRERTAIAPGLATHPQGPVESAADRRLRIVRVHHYTMAGRIRPLLFWFGRDNVGLARLVWRVGDADARGYELLVGTDPARAPRSLNRWGYIAEEVEPPGGSLFAIMTGTDHASYDEAAASASQPGSDSRLRAIESRVNAGHATWRTASLQPPAPVTVHDADAALGRFHRDVSASATRTASISAGARPGFLVAVADLIDIALRSGPPVARRARVEYVFGRAAYDLRARDVRATSIDLDGRSIPVMLMELEIRSHATDARTRFDLTCGTTAELAGVPVIVEWQPRWWLKLSLRLEAESQAAHREP
jgi:hypothetical protein